MKIKLTALVVTALAFVSLCGFANPIEKRTENHMTLTYDVPVLIDAKADTDSQSEADACNESNMIMSQTEKFEVDVINEMNALRALAGMEPLTVDPALMNAAAIRCAELSVSYSHTRPDHTDCFTAYPASYGWAGENIAYGYETPKEVMTAWANSTNHLANMTKPQYKSVGVSFCIAPDGTHYWVQCFGG